MGKRYFWLKVQKDFAKDRRVKKLKNIPGGLNFAFIYLEIILSTIETEGIFIYQGVEDTVAKEIALEIDEDPDNVQITISYLLSVGLMVDLGDGKFLMPYVTENLGSESASAKRVRDFRERKKALQCNTDVTEVKREALHCNTDVTEVKRDCNVEKRREEKENIYRDIKSDKPTLSLEDNTDSTNKRQRAPFTKPTVEQIDEYIKAKGYPIDAQEFFNYYEDRDWFCGKIKMRNWKNALYSWAKNQTDRWPKERAKNQKPKPDFEQNTYDFEALEKDLVRN